MTPREIVRETYRIVLPGKFDSPDSDQLLLAIGFQESRFEHRTQIGGPARGFWQFEFGGGTKGVFNHRATGHYAKAACLIRGVGATPEVAYQVIGQDDILACALARLLLYTDPKSIPSDEQEGWRYYIRVWRPGRPHPSTWPEMWARAKETP